MRNLLCYSYTVRISLLKTKPCLSSEPFSDHGVVVVVVRSFVPVWEAVGGGEHPTGRDKTSSTAENLFFGAASPENGGDPRLSLHRWNRPPDDLHLLPFRPIAARCHLYGTQKTLLKLRRKELWRVNGGCKLTWLCFSFSGRRIGWIWKTRMCLWCDEARPSTQTSTKDVLQQNLVYSRLRLRIFFLSCTYFWSYQNMLAISYWRGSTFKSP